MRFNLSNILRGQSSRRERPRCLRYSRSQARNPNHVRAAMIHLAKNNAMDAPAEFTKLSPDEKALFLSLHYRPLGPRDTVRTNIVRAQQDLRPSVAALSVEEHIKIMAIYETNAFEAGEGSVICPEASRINHSCLPNVNHYWNDTTGRETVHAVKDIAAGEEILTTYIQICRDYAERKNSCISTGSPVIVQRAMTPLPLAGQARRGVNACSSLTRGWPCTVPCQCLVLSATTEKLWTLRLSMRSCSVRKE